MYAKILTGPTIGLSTVEPGKCNCPGNQPEPGTVTIMGKCTDGNSPQQAGKHRKVKRTLTSVDAKMLTGPTIFGEVEPAETWH